MDRFATSWIAGVRLKGATFLDNLHHRNQTSSLLSSVELERSTVVANNRMNRERLLWGLNSYQKELGRTREMQSIDFREFLSSRAQSGSPVRWMDLCCGSGNALIQAALAFRESGLSAAFRLEGLDLAGMFSQIPDSVQAIVHLQTGSVAGWEPIDAYDLITCIHGLHYVGDKLGLLQKALGYLKPGGRMILNQDPNNLKDVDGKPLVSWWRSECRRNGWKYMARRHMLHVVGRHVWPTTWTFLGADDQAGPNYSGQPAVDSYYQLECYEACESAPED